MIPGRIVLGLLVGLVVFAGTAMTQTHEGQRIIALDVRGMKAVAKETILAKVQTKPGGPYRSDAISEDIRRIFVRNNRGADSAVVERGRGIALSIFRKISMRASRD